MVLWLRALITEPGVAGSNPGQSGNHGITTGLHYLTLKKMNVFFSRENCVTLTLCDCICLKIARNINNLEFPMIFSLVYPIRSTISIPSVLNFLDNYYNLKL
uniref:Uncharacterized protein n=1 Tax=Cacopsylla melanoneura TaxID=428564 RepID=A0A8D8QT05_9HEMI